MEWANSFFNLCYTVTCLTLTSQWCRWSDDDRTYLSVKIPNTENACKISFFRFCSVGRLPLEKMVWTNLTRLDEPYQTVWHSSQSVHKWSLWLIFGKFRECRFPWCLIWGSVLAQSRSHVVKKSSILDIIEPRRGRSTAPADPYFVISAR